MQTKDTKRAERRHHDKRLKRNRKTYWGGWVMNPNRVGQLLHTPKNCSCWMCGNPRKYAKGNESVTIQELSNQEFLKTLVE